jgi:hypothetical protein
VIMRGTWMLRDHLMRVCENNEHFWLQIMLYVYMTWQWSTFQQSQLFIEQGVQRCSPWTSRSVIMQNGFNITFTLNFFLKKGHVMLTSVIICPIISSGWIFMKLTVDIMSVEATILSYFLIIYQGSNWQLSVRLIQVYEIWCNAVF